MKHNFLGAATAALLVFFPALTSAQAWGPFQNDYCDTPFEKPCSGNTLPLSYASRVGFATHSIWSGITIPPPVSTSVKIASSSVPAYTTKVSRTPPTGAEAVASCLMMSFMRPLTPADGKPFTVAATPFNFRLHYTPAIIVYPTNEVEVANALACATGQVFIPGTPKFAMRVQARSGGHSYAAYSLGGRDGSLIIDLANFDDLTVDSNGIATVGAGIRLGSLAEGIYAQGKRALPHGTCPGVGIGGHATHGGYGYSSRSWGLTLDTIVALDVVLANSSILHVNKTSYPAIYWAMRGAADSFGIITKFYFQTLAAPEEVVSFNYLFQLMDQTLGATPEKTAKAFLHIQDVAQNASAIDRRTSLGMFISRDTFLVRGVYNGSVNDAAYKTFVSELLRGLPKPSAVNVTTLSWMENNGALGGNPDSSFDPPAPGAPGSNDTFYAKSLVVPEHSPLTEVSLVNYFTYLMEKGKDPKTGDWFSIPNVYGGPDSQINTKDTDFAAYSDRKALWVFQHWSSQAPFTQTAHDFVTGMSVALKEKAVGTNFTAYLNYVDDSYTAKVAHKYYYGAGLSEKLRALKREVDPKNTFWNPQAFTA